MENFNIALRILFASSFFITIAGISKIDFSCGNKNEYKGGIKMTLIGITVFFMSLMTVIYTNYYMHHIFTIKEINPTNLQIDTIQTISKDSTYITYNVHIKLDNYMLKKENLEYVNLDTVLVKSNGNLQKFYNVHYQRLK